MKALIAIAVLFLVAALSGCATTPTPGTTQTEPANLRNVDQDYVRRVNYHAGRTGTRVFWVNPPQRKIRVEEEERP